VLLLTSATIFSSSSERPLDPRLPASTHCGVCGAVAYATTKMTFEILDIEISYFGMRKYIFQKCRSNSYIKLMGSTQVKVAAVKS